jgi:acetolactate synthase-1/2/3 large subunit
VLGNGLIGTMEAYLSSSPILLLTDFSDAAPSLVSENAYSQGPGRWSQVEESAEALIWGLASLA